MMYLSRDSLKRGSQGGFTVVEMLVAMFITAVIATAVYTVYNSYFRQGTIQEMTIEAQQNARVAINMIERELMNAGYASATADVITEATSTSIEFIYTDPETDTAMSATAQQRLKVRYALQTAGGVQYLTKKVDNLTTATTGTTEKVIPDVQGLTLTYYGINGDVKSTTTTQAQRNEIKFVTVNLVTQTKEVLPGTTTKKTYMVETHIRLRNIGIGQTSLDTTAPAGPTGPEVRDPGTCSRLKLRWALNAEGDVAGYKVYYGTSSGNYTGVLNISNTVLSTSQYSCATVGTNMECTIYPSTPSLQYTASNVSPGSETIYYLAVKAYDNSLNHSVYSSEVSGNPSPSNATFGTGSNDSTINPVKPSAAAGFAGADSATDNQVDLSWTAYDTATYPDVAGFRVYRSTSAFSAYPIDPADPTVDWIAGEPGSGLPALDQSATSYTDVGPGLLGCRTYYYAIAPVNCDASLVTDDGSDPSTFKYEQTDYDATCGDGTAACSAGTGFSSVAGSDTSPAEANPPSSPANFGARAGWKRVAVSFDQPSDTDISHTCIYSEQGSSYPSILSSIDLVGCYDVTSPAIRLYESGGKWDTTEVAAGATSTFWHNSMTSLTSIPSLLDTGTYSYRAVAFDLCGNGSPVAGAQATTTLCGEDPAGKPIAATGLGAYNCSTPASLTWTGVPSSVSLPSSAANPWDLAGYRIMRSSSSSDWSASTLLNPSAPLWATSFNDTTLTEGGTYYYRVVTTDCPYEKVNPTEATIRSDMIGGTLNYVQSGAITPGMLDRDEKCVGAGSCTKDLHREVITGVDIDATTGSGTGASTPSSGLTHDTVTLFFNNTSAGSMTITGASVTWVESSATLDKIEIGGGRSGIGETHTDFTAGQTTSVTGNPPYTSTVSNATLTSATITAGARYVPIRFTFDDSSGNPVDMRDDQLLVTLKVTNDSTGTGTCRTYLTVSMASQGITVPFGPSITATQQAQPSSPTYSYAVPGSTGLNTVPSGSDASVLVGSSINVSVSANIAGNTTNAQTGLKVPVSSATLYYRVTANTVTTAPTSGYSSVAMTNTGGNIWSGTVPANDGFRIWYYIIAIDDDGNFDRDPEAAYGAYVYDQQTFDACNVTPSATTDLTAGVVGSDVTLTWSVPATYTNGATLSTVTDPVTYNVYKGGASIATGVGSPTYGDTGLASGVFSYYITTSNSCATPGPNVSDVSNTVAACVGLSGQASLSVSPTTIYQGNSYDVTIVDCLAANGAYASTVEVVNSTAGFTGFTNTSTAPGTYNPTVTETGAATATFPVTIQTTANVLDTGKLLVLPTDTITVYYPFATPTSVAVSVVSNPCNDTPDSPTSLTGSVTGQSIDLSWSAVTTNDDATAISDLAGYRVYEKVCAKNKPNCTGADIVADWFLRTTVGSGTTATTVASDQGNVSQRIYYFRVAAIDSCSTPNEGAFSPEWNE